MKILVVMELFFIFTVSMSIVSRLSCCITVLQDNTVGRKLIKDHYIISYDYMLIYNYLKIKSLIKNRYDPFADGAYSIVFWRTEAFV